MLYMRRRKRFIDSDSKPNKFPYFISNDSNIKSNGLSYFIAVNERAYYTHTIANEKTHKVPYHIFITSNSRTNAPGLPRYSWLGG